MIEDMDIEVLKKMGEVERQVAVNAWLRYRDTVHGQIRDERIKSLQGDVATANTVVANIRHA